MKVWERYYGSLHAVVDASAHIRSDGWRKVDGVWYCPDCAEEDELQ